MGNKQGITLKDDQVYFGPAMLERLAAEAERQARKLKGGAEPYLFAFAVTARVLKERVFPEEGVMVLPDLEG